MTVSTIVQTEAPAKPLITEADRGKLLALLRLPDVSGLALPDDPTPQDLAELVTDLEERLAEAGRIYAEVIREIAEMRQIARDQIERAIPADGHAIPWDGGSITLEQRYERKRGVADLLDGLTDKVPADELRKALFIKSLDVKGCADQIAIAALEKAGAKAVWECDLRKLDVIGRTYGGDIADTITRATEKVPVGPPHLVVKRHEPTMKLISGGRA